LAPDEARKLIAHAYEAGVRYIDFTGGEPSLYQHLPELLRYAKGLGVKTEVTTNGIPHSPDRLQEIARCTDKFNLSLDTLNPDVYRRIRGVDCLENVLKTMELLAPIRPPKIMTVVTQENLPELDSMICYAQRHQAEIYLNPVFSYSDLPDGGGNAAAIQQITEKIFEPYTVVMLHFMEFLAKPGEGRPPCSANSRTLTIAPDGALVLPCYHAIKETVPWHGSLTDMLASEAFARYAKLQAQNACSGTCPVVPYFGISFNYRLDAYFLMQSYSEKLNHLKRDYLNHLPELTIDTARLQHHLKELLTIIRSLKTRPEYPDRGLYWAEQTDQGWHTDVYRENLTEEQYLQEQTAADCWELTLVPHHALDTVVGRFLPKAFAYYRGGAGWAAVQAVFQDIMEFQLRLWKYYISRYMNVSITCDFSEEKSWLVRYMDRLENWGKNW